MSDIDSSDSETSWQECEENTNEHEAVTCIFSGKIFQGAEIYFRHLKNNHNFDIWNLVHVELGLDFFGYVKLINYLRINYKGKSIPTASVLLSQKEVWNNDESYLKPVVENDPLLQFIIDTDVEDDEDFVSPPGASGVNGGAGEHHDPAMDVPLTRENLSHALATNVSLSSQVVEMKMRITEMKRVMQDIMIKNGDIYRPVSACRKPLDNDDQEDEEFEDSGYFRSYDHFDIHREMLQDKTRTCAYRDAMLKNPALFKDKVVLDVGCGTGILSMFAVKAGAKCVYAVERSDIASSATANIYQNGMADKIKILHTSVEEIDLPVKHVDIIISEWMGYFLLYESMLDSVLHAASKWLAPDGVMLPNQCSIILAAADADAFNQHVSYWDDVYGFKMPCMKTAVLREASVLNIPVKDIITSKAEVFDLTIDRNTTQKQLDFKNDFKIRALRDGKCSAIVGYFDVNFILPEERVTLSTEPVTPGSGKETHWKQTVFFLPTPIDVEKDQLLSGHIDCRKNPADPRSLLVDLMFNGEIRQYTIS